MSGFFRKWGILKGRVWLWLNSKLVSALRAARLKSSFILELHHIKERTLTNNPNFYNILKNKKLPKHLKYKIKI